MRAPRAGAGSDQAGSTVQVAAKDVGPTLPTDTSSPGEYTFQTTNDGSATHAIEVDGPGVEDEKSDTAGPGGTAPLTGTLQQTLQQGDSTMYCPVEYCPVDGHRAMGAETTFTVG